MSKKRMSKKWNKNWRYSGRARGRTPDCVVHVQKPTNNNFKARQTIFLSLSLYATNYDELFFSFLGACAVVAVQFEYHKMPSRRGLRTVRATRSFEWPLCGFDFESLANVFSPTWHFTFPISSMNSVHSTRIVYGASS